jgi:two-component system sensor histidine kinase/response regulator
VHLAENGAEALRMLESETFDAVLMDVQMPVMDGLAATREIRRRERLTGQHVCIIAITASATTEVEDDGYAAYASRVSWRVIPLVF